LIMLFQTAEDPRKEEKGPLTWAFALSAGV
jgi:hypothetical protein